MKLPYVTAVKCPLSYRLKCCGKPDFFKPIAPIKTTLTNSLYTLGDYNRGDIIVGLKGLVSDGRYGIAAELSGNDNIARNGFINTGNGCFAAADTVQNAVFICRRSAEGEKHRAEQKHK